MTRFHWLISGLAAAALVAVLALPLDATTIPEQQGLRLGYSPLFANPDSQSEAAGTTPRVGITDRSPATSGAFQRLIIQNLSSANNLCAYWVAAAATCGSATTTCDGIGTDDGTFVLPGSSWDVTVAGNLRTCVSASASPTRYHISRAEVP